MIWHFFHIPAIMVLKTNGIPMSFNIIEIFMHRHHEMNILLPKLLGHRKTTSGPFYTLRFSKAYTCTCTYHFLKWSFKNFWSESGFFYFIFDPDVIAEIMKTKLNEKDLNGRCSHLKNYPNKFKIAELSFQK